MHNKKDISKLCGCERVKNFDWFDVAEHGIQSSIDHVIEGLYVMLEQLSQFLEVRYQTRFNHHLH